MISLPVSTSLPQGCLRLASAETQCSITVNQFLTDSSAHLRAHRAPTRQAQGEKRFPRLREPLRYLIDNSMLTVQIRGHRIALVVCARSQNRSRTEYVVMCFGLLVDLGAGVSAQG